MYQQHRINDPQRCMPTYQQIVAACHVWEDNSELYRTSFQVGSITDQYLPNPMSGKKHHEIAVEMDLGIFTRHARANVENVEVQCH